MDKEKLMIQYDNGIWVPKDMCTIDQFGGADDCASCKEVCKDLDGDCEECPVQGVFNQLAAYEAAGLTPEQAEVAKWVPCSERMPEPEREVEITYTRQHYRTGETMYLTARAFYEDGTITVEESAHGWDDCSVFEPDEESDSYLIPEGWFEGVSFAESFAVVDEPVIAWRPLAEPYTGKES